MPSWLKSRWSRVGVALVVIGWLPLLGIVLLNAVGLWPDPAPNPIGPGLLFFISFWPALISLGIGIWRSRCRQRR